VIFWSTSPSAFPPWLFQITRSPFLKSWLISLLLLGVSLDRGHAAVEARAASCRLHPWT
jgi:hypothetical protein